MKYTIVLLCLITFSVDAQLYMRGVAPVKPGNFWKYTTYDFWDPTITSTIAFSIKDSNIIIEENKFYIVEVFGENWSNPAIRYLGISPDNFNVKFDSLLVDNLYRYYKINCQLGDSWDNIYLTCPIHSSVIDTFTITAWGKPYLAKYIYIDCGLIQMYQVWTDYFGLMNETSEAQYSSILNGCVIDGVVYGDTSIVTGISEDTVSPKNYYLSQNYPNPFNPSTTISFSIPERSFVTLKVYDMLGREVANLVNEELEPGSFEKTFDASTLSSGVYIYRITATKDGKILFNESKQMLMIK